MLTRRTLLIALASLPGCGAAAVTREPPGVHELTDQIRGKKRRSLLFVPEALGDRGPMLVGLHDAGETPEIELERWRDICAAEGWVGLFPDYQKGDFKEDNTNLTHVLQRATAMGGVQPNQLFVTGHGTGGRRAYALAASHSGLLKAVATSGAVLAFNDTREVPIAPGVSVLHIHGLNDEAVPFLGGPLPSDPKRIVLPATEALKPWIQLANPSATDVVGHRTTWTGPTHAVVLIADPEGDHARTHEQTEAIRDFFKLHR